MAQYKTAPDQNDTGWPSGVKYIVGNEGCERFSYYGMNAILYVYVVSLLVGNQLSQDAAGNEATSVVHFFKTGVYAFPMIGAIVADRLFGKYHTILWLSGVYCLGHLVLSLTEGSYSGLYAGLFLIALGSGGIKPCVSAHVGDQFGKSNWSLINRVYQAFYFIINFGSFFSVILIPLLKEWFGWRVAFAVPGILMFVATVVFWMGRKDFVHIPAKPGGRLGAYDAVSSTLLFLTFGSFFFTATAPAWVMVSVSSFCFLAGLMVFFARQRIEQDDGFLAVSLESIRLKFRELTVRLPLIFAKTSAVRTSGGSGSGGGYYFSGGLNTKFSEEAIEGSQAMLRLMSVFLMVSIFWALFDQHASSWIRQAEMMNREVSIFGSALFTVLPSQVPSINPILVMLLLPLLTFVVFPFVEKFVKLTPLRKMTAGMFIASTSFVAVALIQSQIDEMSLRGEQIHVLWQVVPYCLITLAEVLVSVTGLEFAYSQAPRRMKSTVMGFWLLTVAFGNVLVALLAKFSELELVNFFWVFAGLMAIAAVLFGVRASTCQVKDYPQE